MKNSNTSLLVLGQIAVLSLSLLQVQCAASDDTTAGAGGAAGQAGTGEGGETGTGGAGMSHIYYCRNPGQDDEKCMPPGDRPVCAGSATCIRSHPADPADMQLECLYRVSDDDGCPCVQYSVRKCTISGSQKGVQRCEDPDDAGLRTAWSTCGPI